MSKQDQSKFLPPEIEKQFFYIIDELCHRLIYPKQLKSIVDQPGNHEPLFDTSVWAPCTISHVLCGTSIFYSILANKYESFRAVAHNHLLLATSTINWCINGGVMGGPSGLLAAAQIASRSPMDYSKLREQLTAWICRCQLYLINRYRSSLGNGVPWLAYDIMNGICGNLRILLDENSTNARETINLSVKYLCDLVLTSNSQGMPGWWVPGNLQPTKQDENEYPDGDLNVGVAHGAAGILGTLVSVFNYGYTDTRVMDSIKRIMEWTFHWTQHADDFDYWPARIPTNCQIQDDVLSPLPTRAGWCYGTPGIAVEMLRASTLLDDVDTTGHIIDILSSHLSSPTNQWHIAGPTFCHGYAGVLYSVFKAWTLCGSEVLRNIGSNMANNLLAMADECSPFVYQHWMYSNTPSHKINLKKLDNVGLLEGSSGIGLVLYSICNQGDSSANWDRVFALS